MESRTCREQFWVIVLLKRGAYLPKDSSSFSKVMQESFKTYVLATITKQNADISYLGSYPRIELLRGVNITFCFPWTLSARQNVKDGATA